jgi:hypothetical protein
MTPPASTPPTPTSPVVVDPTDLTPAWLTAVLGRPITGADPEPVGTGQIGTCYRLTLESPTAPGGTERIVAKLPAPDPGLRELLAGAYRGEVRFYSELAATVAVRAPAAHHVAMTPGTGDFTLLLEDLAPWRQGDQLAGCTVAQARDAAVNLAGLHGPRWCDPALLDVEGLSVNGPAEAALLAEVYGPAVETFASQLDGLLEPADVEVLRRSAEVVEAWALARAERFALVHGDYRLDNLMFPHDGSPGVCAVDWQTISLAVPARDVAYLVATSLPEEQRRAHEDALVAAYHGALLGYGVEGYDLALCREDYRFSMLQGPLVAVLGCVYGTRSERGDRMFAAMVRRSCRAIRDLETFSLVPST